MGHRPGADHRANMHITNAGGGHSHIYLIVIAGYRYRA
jgi:hypothetical protein